MIKVGGPRIAKVHDVLGRTFAATAAVRADILLTSHSSAQNDICLIVPAGQAEPRLGFLGPLIRAEVGDTIQVIFRNNAKRPYSMHPHGVFYNKDSEGAPYEDGTSGADKADDGVPPGGTHKYTWQVPERAGPAWTRSRRRPSATNRPVHRRASSRTFQALRGVRQTAVRANRFRHRRADHRRADGWETP